MPKRLTINDMRRVAAAKGGRCLSETYINNKTKLLWECGQKHQWEAMPAERKAQNVVCRMRWFEASNNRRNAARCNRSARTLLIGCLHQ